ncbi:hypothetical protein BDV23DRAFT_143764 [Aspergillus alliaceus]|uniref:Uncharacterized protein n=1 Tax=Petromyces alliaceus TaxID=209559 RepID=A0A5N7CQT6_PETAA|nr:uncharacterized protein BDW43DRAFT_17419 [Aspergillus alliaceus]KAB8236014.1 hypothetical protein BDW43DRAFT_17419 [Aspergillus alliaceus]KAE8396279.1 hypothetical protein BDV23DRAFT_143764 [Aspergillus alliaceus]
MLLPSALPCDMRRSATRSRPTPSRQFTTPPPSDDDFPSGNGLLGTCRALQSLLSGSPAPSPRCAKPERLQSPLHIRSTPSTRSRKPKAPKPSPKPSRSANRRKRDRDEEIGDTSDTEITTRGMRFSTPKRARHVPYDLPIGLSQSDFYSLHSPPVSQSPLSPAHHRQMDLTHEKSAQSLDPDAPLPSIEETEETPSDDPWNADDDQRLVELVLEKFQLSKRDWEDCARRMGKDDVSVGRRWQALIGEGNVGLRRGRRVVRPRIMESWL